MRMRSMQMPNTNMAVLEQENPVRNLPGPYPFKYPTPYTPRGINSPSNLADYF